MTKNNSTFGCVLVSRNDDYGGRLVERATYVINSCIETYDEVILVDYNSRDGTLFEELEPNLIRKGNFCCIFVPNKFHLEATKDFERPQPCSEVLGRNIGLRRLGTDYLISTNIDEINPPREYLEKYQVVDKMITVARHGTTLEHVETLGGFQEIEKIRNHLISNYYPQAWAVVREPWSKVEWCGDLQLAHRDLMYEIRGFEEWQLGTSFADTYIQRKVIEIGKEVEAVYDIPIYHLDHNRSSKWGESNAANTNACLEPTFMGMLNPETWGFSEVVFEEARL